MSVWGWNATLSPKVDFAKPHRNVAAPEHYMREFADIWRAFYPNVEPTGRLMRAADVPHWIRFHSLPLSKRYADTEEEYSTLLSRQNALASAALGNDRPCWIVQACWTTTEGTVELADESEMFRASRDFGLEHAFSFDVDEGADAEHWKVMAGPVRWRQGGFDEVLLRVADEQSAPILWVSAESGAVFAPYDGGVDLFLTSEAEVTDLRSKHVDWLPSHPDGL